MNIGLVLPLAEDLSRGHQAGYAEIRALALHAEAGGFDALWLYDHFLYREPDQPTQGMWEVWTVLSALAEATQRIELGALVICTAFRPPALLAKMATTLDEVSGGRFTLGIGAGWHRPEFEALGLPFDRRAARFEEALQILVPLLREGHADFQGTFYRAARCELVPRGPSPTGPRLLIGAGGPRMLRLTATYAHSWNTLASQPHVIAERLTTIRAACASVGRDPATLEVTADVKVLYPDLMDHAVDGEDYVVGTPEELVTSLQAYEALGLGQVTCRLLPTTTETLARFTQTLRLYRSP